MTITTTSISVIKHPDSRTRPHNATDKTHWKKRCTWMPIKLSEYVYDNTTARNSLSHELWHISVVSTFKKYIKTEPFHQLYAPQMLRHYLISVYSFKSSSLSLIVDYSNYFSHLDNSLTSII